MKNKTPFAKAPTPDLLRGRTISRDEMLDILSSALQLDSEDLVELKQTLDAALATSETSKNQNPFKK